MKGWTALYVFYYSTGTGKRATVNIYGRKINIYIEWAKENDVRYNPEEPADQRLHAEEPRFPGGEAGQGLAFPP